MGAIGPGTTRPVSSRNSQRAALFVGFVDFKEPAGQGPTAGERIVLAADQEQAERIVDPGEGREIDRDGGSGVFITIRG